MSMQQKRRCLIVGASHAGAQAAVALRQHGWEGDITLIGDEPHLPYQRPPLSKDFLCGNRQDEDILIRQASFYQKSAVHILLGSQAIAIHRAQQQLEMDTGDKLEYDVLILATGARARRMDIPGAQLEGIHYLRNLDDVRHICRSAAPPKTGGHHRRWLYRLGNCRFPAPAGPGGHRAGSVAQSSRPGHRP